MLGDKGFEPMNTVIIIFFMFANIDRKDLITLIHTWKPLVY